ncbi:hypothetical protein HELRODRAFT_185524 [Helobdella robusta]|uniref:AAA+ ATPase domain-containing protein n=1 Tax=Helobdella robusta TaxID=6412 RepID=T1FMX6_HELRO|nr:hypothetical protein HELRODRAFT_185524 [Helobdella robusta]ESO04899.1 hypothetical protein HELRODRAFT_185524 [Helobdella robusta]
MSTTTSKPISTATTEIWNEIKTLFQNFKFGFNSAPSIDEEIKRLALQRQELITKLIVSTIGTIVTIGVSYYGLKWLFNQLDPSKKDNEEFQLRAKALMKKIGVNVQLTEHELSMASNLVIPSSMKTEWKDIGGLQEIIEEIKEAVIDPFKHKELFASTRLVEPPKGVLLYGPPGCGKTMIAKAIAKATGARFLSLNVSSLVDKWYGESQKKAEAIFTLARKLQPTIIFIDEIDSFLRQRSFDDHEASSMIKTQFMSFWDGLTTDDRCQIVVIGATNRPKDVDPAILRRMPSKFYIGLPNLEQRKEILKLVLQNESVHHSVNLDEIAVLTEGWSGSDLRELCRAAAVLRVRKLIKLSEEITSTSSIPTSLGELDAEDFKKAFERLNQGKIMMTSSTVYQQFCID